jgi:uncharacterized protein YukE
MWRSLLFLLVFSQSAFAQTAIEALKADYEAELNEIKALQMEIRKQQAEIQQKQAKLEATIKTVEALKLRLDEVDSKTDTAQNTANDAISRINNVQLECVNGLAVKSEKNQWTSSYSTCPSGYTVVGLARIDLHGIEADYTNQVNDFRCDNNGCQAWCVHHTCTVVSRCCRVVSK